MAHLKATDQVDGKQADQASDAHASLKAGNLAGRQSDEPGRNQAKHHAAQLNRSLIESLKHAGAGLKRVFLDERNFRVQLLCTLAVVIFGLLLRVDRGEWLILVLMCILVLILEMVNTAIEAIVDMTVGKHFHECAQKAKDVAAGAVVVAAIAALVNGFVIFLPAAIRLIEAWS